MYILISRVLYSLRIRILLQAFLSFFMYVMKTSGNHGSQNQVRLYPQLVTITIHETSALTRRGRPLALVVTVQKEDEVDTPHSENSREI